MLLPKRSALSRSLADSTSFVRTSSVYCKCKGTAVADARLRGGPPRAAGELELCGLTQLLPLSFRASRAAIRTGLGFRQAVNNCQELVKVGQPELRLDRSIVGLRHLDSELVKGRLQRLGSVPR